MFAKVKHQLQDLTLFWRGLLRGEYPEFIRKPVAPVTIPVFTYHTVLEDEFDAQLSYLKDNGYFTLDTDEFFKYYQEHQAFVDHGVMLTFDDGTKDFYEVAFPLLQKYRMKAVVFIIPNWMGKAGMLNWVQIREMHQSGLVDFQSHTLGHNRIFISPQVVDFVQPQQSAYSRWNMPVVRVDGADVWGQTLATGTPIYENASRMSDLLRFFPPEEVSRQCEQYVLQNGGENFFKQKNWRRKLHEFHAQVYQQFQGEARYETKGEQEDQIRTQLLQARLKIEQEIPGKKVKHFAFPWNQDGRLSRGLLGDCGYDSAYGGMAKQLLKNGRPVDRTYINRVSGDFIFALPGQGRLSMSAILTAKIKRRLTKGAMY